MIIIFILALLGIFDTGYLSFVHLFAEQTCGRWVGCTFVLSSPHSRIFGVPLSALGLGAYICLAFLTLRAYVFKKKIHEVPWIFCISLIGSLISIYFIYIQASLIKHWCPFCLLSSILIISIFVLNISFHIHNKPSEIILKFHEWRLKLTYIVFLMILPSIIFLVIEQTGVDISNTSVIPDRKVVANIGDRKITLREIDQSILLSLNQLDWMRYKVRLQWLESELLSMEASRQNLTLEQLIKKNIDDVVKVSEEEILEYYRSDQMQNPEIPLNNLKERINDILKTEKRKLRMREFLAQLKFSYNANFFLPRPSSLSMGGNLHRSPEMGPADAEITVILFADFECPFCDKAYNLIKDLCTRYPKNVRVVFRNFPLELHRNAKDAAYAASCAHLQGKFWDYADILFKNKEQLELSKLYDYADIAGLDRQAFRKCMESGQGEQIVNADISEGVSLGLEGTPAFFFKRPFYYGTT